MKRKTNLLIGGGIIIAMILCLGFAACDNNSGGGGLKEGDEVSEFPSSIRGTWQGVNDRTLEITSNTITFKDPNGDVKVKEGTFVSGTYKYKNGYFTDYIGRTDVTDLYSFNIDIASLEIASHSSQFQTGFKNGALVVYSNFAQQNFRVDTFTK